MTNTSIELRGVTVHNLKSIDVDIPHNQLVLVCGVSGSGKTSLALDTLYAEGQRRYIESFSAYTRQFLERLEKPAADRIDGIPPAIAVTHKNTTQSSRTTVGTSTESTEFLRLLYAKIATVHCEGCGERVQRDTPTTVVERLRGLADGTRFQIAFPFDSPEILPALREDGFVRVLFRGKTWNISDPQQLEQVQTSWRDGQRLWGIVDRLAAGSASAARARDSLETAFNHGNGRCDLFVSHLSGAAEADRSLNNESLCEIDGSRWRVLRLSSAFRCESCQREYARPEPRLFSFNSPLGACPTCEGFGNVMAIDMDLVVPDTSKSLAEGAIAPWTTPAYSHELDELLALASDYEIPTSIPFRELNSKHRRLIENGVPEREFGGLNGFFRWLERRKYKMHIRVFLSRWRSYRLCEACGGARLRPEALAAKIAGKSIADLSGMEVLQLLSFLESLELSEHDQRIVDTLLKQIRSRLHYLQMVGLGYLTLNRTLRTLSGGEAQRVALTSALGSSLVNMLYVLDEPSVGLHPQDVQRLLEAIEQLHRRGNTVVLVEHEESMIQAAQHVIEIGPGAGEDGGRVVFAGSPVEMVKSEASLTGDYLAGRRGVILPETRRQPGHGWIRLTGARGNNLKNVEVELPLGVLCLVTGVSGSGKSSLVEQTLYPALCQRKRKDSDRPLPYDDVFGDGQLDDVILVDQSPLSRSPRSNPVTYIKAFDAIREVFAETLTARTHNYTASHFSFNVDGGRCDACKGDGFNQIDMQFLADIYMKCSVCHGRRYRREILEVTYRDKSIADILDMTVRRAFMFFRGQTKVQQRLQRLMDVGLDYLRLGQPANTLSAGEAQRLKLAGYLASARRGRTLFLMDEPTTGLHFSDIVQLLDCFEALLNMGHSLIVVEHNLQMMRAADYIVDLGPGASDDGGQVVAQGTPEMVARNSQSATGQVLARQLQILEAGEAER
ncbi:MAG: excinuclease ABC subunit UvrA [Planctomycetales bacterium]|nr:excinuclease ABC subunit UvrA [Planctomycetales bacterium]